MSEYTDGPADQSWEVVIHDRDDWIYVQRHGWDARRYQNSLPPYEMIYSFINSSADQREQAQWLAGRLNELDRARALIAAIATHLDSPSWGHELMSADDGLLVECQGQDVLRAMLEDYRNGH